MVVSEPAFLAAFLHPTRKLQTTFVCYLCKRYVHGRRPAMSSSFQQLRVWQEAMKLASDIYRATAQFPRHEVYGLSQQMRRAAVSVPSNIAEGKGHRSNREFTNFLLHARG